MDGSTTDEKARSSAADRRKQTEVDIIAAFERVLRREGVRNVGVNNVVKEARIGKGLIYKYFGGLAGVAAAWIQRTSIWPDHNPILKRDGEPAGARAPEKIKQILRQHADTLRDNPLAAEILVEELARPTELTEAFGPLRDRLGESHCQVFQSDREFIKPVNRALLVLLYAATTYVAMRSAQTPSFMGFDLSQDKDWQEMLGMVDLLVDRAVAADGPGGADPAI